LKGQKLQRRGREDLLNFIELLLDEGDLDQALFLNKQHLKRFPDDPEALLLRGHVLVESGDFEAALKSFARAQELVPDWEEAGLIYAGVLLDLGHLDEAQMMLAPLTQSHPENAHIHHVLAISFELCHNQLGAHRHYRQAAQLNRNYTLPYRISDEQLQHFAEKKAGCLSQLLPQYSQRIEVIVADLPRPEFVDRNGRPLSPLTLGFARQIDGGAPRTEIQLFKQNIERVCTNLGEIKEQIAITLEHELVLLPAAEGSPKSTV
jgi:tetratricopeptide (TPR) repeat protein